MPADYDSIRKKNIKGYGEYTHHISYLGKLYTDRTHFIFELLQNAEDACATIVLFKVFEDRLEVLHDGRPFNESDVKGICGVGEGTKTEDLTKIGKFGIGFKSVYAYTNTPEIHSGKENFIIENYVRPYSTDPELLDNNFTTLFIFPFNNEEITPEKSCKEISERLINLNARTLLFLRKIEEIEYILPDSKTGTYLREGIINDSASREVTVIGQNNGKEEYESWLVFQASVSELEESENVNIEIAYRFSFETKKCKEINKINNSPLIVYFPTEKDTRLGFLIQGPYRTTPARDNIPKDDEWNQKLINKTAELVKASLHEIKGRDLLTVSFLDSLPIRAEDFPEDGMFYPIFDAVLESLSTEKLLPADDGSFTSADNGVLARGSDLRKLLTNEQLTDLYELDGPIKWISGKITQDRTPDLFNYLKNEVDVEVLTPEVFARKLSESFMKKQPDNWMVEFYNYISERKELWKKQSRYTGQTDGILISKPIIRLQSGEHVNPFYYGNHAHAYLLIDSDTSTSLPFVKKEITENESVYNFLKELGIPELDHIEEIINNILPKYKDNSKIISMKEHHQDIKTIVNAYNTDSYDEKNRLKKSLKLTPFILIEDCFNIEPEYCRLEELYFKNDDLKVYFSGNDSVAFVSSDYSEDTISMFKDIGLEDFVRIKYKEPDYQGHVVIKDSYGMHERGLDGFDLNIYIDGIENALMTPNPEKSEFIWNKIAVPYSDSIQGTIESCPRQTYDRAEKRHEISNFGHLLINSEWMPDTNGNFKKPADLKLDDLPESFIKDRKLANHLGMKQNLVAKFAEEVGISIEHIDIIQKNPEAFSQWIEGVGKKDTQPAFPTKPVKNHERRQEKFEEQFSQSPEKQYKKRERNTRITNKLIDPIIWLRSNYTNEEGQMVCQICKEEMPFRKKNGEYYFEKKEMLSNEYFKKEHETQYLALCPVCAAKYNEFIINDNEAMEKLKENFVNSESCEVEIILGNQYASIRFIESHYHDLKLILNESI
ncbi:MAG: hypothetical protein RBR08_11640 [Desulforegulaceae bacterium]|nr:hypothetical protein [Desulforegulaceae bacterium]